MRADNKPLTLVMISVVMIRNISNGTMRLIKLTTTLLFLLATLTTQAATLQGKVVHIADGDTLTILTNANQQVKIRLAGIDTPEKAQPFGNKAKQVLAALTFQKQASIEVETKDKYGRTVGRVIVNGIDINAELVRQGIAWVYRKYTNDQMLYALEAEAKQAKRGLWATEYPIEPWLWRKGRRTVEHDTSIVKGMIIGNKNSHIYHLPNCQSYYAVSEKNRVLFTNEELAKANGYRKAGNCP
jgi:endonuclease YncB( thermonuclease family)